MLVELKKLLPNPKRDFKVDPVDEERVKILAESIRDDGFWGGVVCRRVNSHIQIAAGHHRVAAAILAGVKTHDLFVSDDMDDAAMVRIYARENATQRGSTSTAIAGSIAAALRFVGKLIFMGDVGRILATSPKSLETLQGQIATQKGIGWDVILRFLQGIPEIDKYVVETQLANLKASGDYARIINEVREEIEIENEENLRALAELEKQQKEAKAKEKQAKEEERIARERRKKAQQEAEQARLELERKRAEEEAKLSEKRRKETEEELKQFEALRKTRDTVKTASERANKEEITFDLSGVSKYLTNAYQVKVFRQCVTAKGIRPHLKVNNQAKLAKHLVELAKEMGKEDISASFIRENIVSMVLGIKNVERTITKSEQDVLMKEDVILKAKNYQHDFVRGFKLMFSAGTKLNSLLKKWPKGLPFPITGEFRKALADVKTIVDQLTQNIP